MDNDFLKNLTGFAEKLKEQAANHKPGWYNYVTPTYAGDDELVRIPITGLYMQAATTGCKFLTKEIDTSCKDNKKLFDDINNFIPLIRSYEKIDEYENIDEFVSNDTVIISTKCGVRRIKFQIYTLSELILTKVINLIEFYK